MSSLPGCLRPVCSVWEGRRIYRCRCVTPLIRYSVPAFPNLISKCGVPSCARYLSRAKPIFSTLLPTENNMWSSCVQPHKNVRLRWILSYFPPRWESGVISLEQVITPSFGAGRDQTNSLALRAVLVLSWRLKTRLALWHAVVFPSPPQVHTRAFSSH